MELHKIFIKSILALQIVKIHMIISFGYSFDLMAHRLDRRSMSVLKCASILCLNPFATYVKDILSRSTKKTVAEL